MMEEQEKDFFFLEKLRSKLRKGFSDEASTRLLLDQVRPFISFSFPVAFFEFKWLVYKWKDCLNCHNLFSFSCLRRENNLSITNLSEKYDSLYRAIAKMHE